MKNKDISLKIIEACKNSQELNDYIQTHYGKSLTYVRGLVLERDEWSENEWADVPMILIDSIKRSEGSRDDEKLYVLSIQTKIKHEDEYGEMPKIDDVVTYTGIDEIEDINEMIIKAIKESVDLRCYSLVDIDSYADPVRFISNETEYNGFIHLVFSKEVTIGCE